MSTRALGPLLVLALGCQRERPKPVAEPASSASARSTPAPTATSVERDEQLEAGAEAGLGEAPELSDIGPAGPATASERGVVMITRDDELVLSALPKTPKESFEGISLDGGAFFPYGRGPALAGDYAYWISKGRLVARRSGGGLEVLAEDARNGTRVATSQIGQRTVVAYVARPASAAGDGTAKLWVSDGEPLLLSPEGSAASSVALVGSMALMLEGRTGMTPVHARRIVERGGRVALEEDAVVWIGGSAQPLSEVSAGMSPSREAWAFVAIERDATAFGLAQIRIGERPRMAAPVTWRAYPNGVDPAPAATARACDETWIAYVRPAEARPGAPQELHLAALGPDGLGAPRILARSRAFANVSLASAGGGLLAVYTADHRTWAARVRCAPKQ